MEDLGTSGKPLSRIALPLDILMEDFVQATSVWRFAVALVHKSAVAIAVTCICSGIVLLHSPFVVFKL